VLRNNIMQSECKCCGRRVVCG